MESQSLVSDVLAKTGFLPKEDLSDRMKKLFAQVSDLKGAVCQQVRDSYVDFQLSVDRMDELKGQVTGVDRDITELKQILKLYMNWMDKLNGQVTGVERDISELKQILKLETRAKLKDLTEMKDMMDEACATVVILQLLNQVHINFKNFANQLRGKEYIEAAATLKNVQDTFKTLADSPFCEHQIVVALWEECTNLKAELHDELERMWCDCILFNKSGTDQSLRIVLDPQLINMLEAMHTMDVLRWKLKCFAKLFKEDILDPIIRESSSVVTVQQTQKELSIRITRPEAPNGDMTPEAKPPDGMYSSADRQFCFMLCAMGQFLSREELSIRITRPDAGNGGATPEAKSPDEMYSQLQSVLQSLHGLFSRCRFQEGDDTSLSLMTKLGTLLWPSLSDDLINYCLAPSIPSSADELENYETTITATQKFEETLESLDFIKDETPLLKYAQEVHIHFATKKCQDILVRARELMKKDLFTAVKVGQKKDDSRKISEFFPVCKISQSTQDLVTLAEDTLREANSEGGAQLFATVRNMFSMFADVVPTYHKQSLEDLPQATALFLNNCLYISHKLKTMGHRFRHTLPAPFRDGIVTFVDLVPTFTRLASDVFLKQMSHQRDQLKESLALARGFQDVSSDDVLPEAERAIKQVLHQLNLLHSVWSDVLPTGTFIKAMSALVGAVLKDIIEKVISLEDISVDDARQLHELLSKIKDGVPSLLKSKYSKDVVVPAVHIKEWTQFNELLFILEASMRDIVERWADGKGPLADAFDHLQLKGLMRALFQNTERRAEALSHIRNL